MLKIGDFSKYSRVTVKALRYYDQLGLLRPVQVDPFTGYRYYSAHQLATVSRIHDLKDLGFSLEEIAALLQEEVSLSQIRSMLVVKRNELQRRVNEEQERLGRVEARLKQIEKELTMPGYEVTIKPVSAQLVASVHETIPTRAEVNSTFNRMFDEVADFINQSQTGMAGSPIAIWHDMEYSDTNMKVEAAWPISRVVSGNERVMIYELPAEATMATTLHYGSFDMFGQAYSALLSWVEQNGYRIAGPNREVYLEYEREGDPAKYVTEVQFPVTKA